MEACKCSKSIEESCWKSCELCFKKFLEKGVKDINKVYIRYNGDTVSLLYLIVFSDRSYYNECIKLLLVSGANPNIQTLFRKNTPLHISQDCKKTEMLLEYGANPFIRNYENKTPRELSNIRYIKNILEEYEEKYMDIKEPE